LIKLTLGGSEGKKIGLSFPCNVINKTFKRNLEINRKVLLLLIGNEIDKVKAYHFINLELMKNEFNVEYKFSDSEASTYINALCERDLNLAYNFYKKIRFAIPNENRIAEIIGMYLCQNPLNYLR
jgi:hypothetical protein